MSTSSIWHIPHQRNPFFTGREDMLNQLYHALRAESIVALSHPQGISGLGGIGKTQIALEYAYRYRSNYNAVFWANASSITALTSSMIELANVLNLPERNEQNQQVIVEAVLRWFSLHTSWLLIYDNIMDDLSITEPFIPKTGSGHILFTTRSYALGGIAQRLDIQKMVPEIGALLLLRRAGLLVIQEALNSAKSDDQDMARRISRELDGLPLALDQAGAYIKEAPCLLSDYLLLYQTRRSTILQERGSFNQDYPASVATTWSLSFEKVQQANPAAAELLNFCAFLAPDAIPEELLALGSACLGEVLAPVVAHPMKLDEVCKEVLRYSLLQRGDDTTLTMHRLVQAVLQDNLPSTIQMVWKQQAVLTMDTAGPDVKDIKQWRACERWIPHALMCATWIEQEKMSKLEAGHLLNQAGYYLHSRGRYREVEPLYIRALQITEQQLGAQHLDTATNLNNLALLYQSQGKYVQVESLYIRALQITEQQLGKQHPTTALSLNNLAGLYYEQGKYTKAEPLYIRALKIREHQLGTQHLDTAQSLNNLANLYCDQGKYTKAEPLYIRALKIREYQSGVLHPDTARSLNNLATFYYDQGKYTKAEPLYVRALAIHEQLLGTEHPNTTRPLNNLAELYRIQGKYAQAELLYMQALQITEQQLGAEHPDTAQSLNNLAILYCDQGKYTQAEPLSVQALRIYEQQLGAEHPNTAQSLSNLAAIYERQGKYIQAEPLCMRALTIREQQLGTEHPNTAQSLNNLAALYFAQGKYTEAEPLYVRALHINEQQLGTQHPNTALSLNNLAAFYYTQGKHTKAEPLYVRALRINEQQMGAEHLATAMSLNNLANVYHAQGKHAKVEPLLKRALAINEKALGRNHTSTQTIRTNYSSLLRAMGRDAEAKHLEAEL